MVTHGDFFMSENVGSQAVTKIRALFRNANKPLCITDIREAIPELKPSQISMTLCYFMRQRYVIRESIDNPRPKERKKIWLYTYSDQRFLEVSNAN
jgi:hypothetical protein